MTINLAALDVKAENLVFTVGEQMQGPDTSALATFENHTAASFLNQILLDVVQGGASDIHFEPYEDMFRIRARFDGVMREMTRLPRLFGKQLLVRIKVIAALDISAHRETQSGRFRMMLNEQHGIDFRASITPTLHGETLVLRLLYLPTEILELSSLGLSDEQIKQINACASRQQGMILVTGPTGSGKTVTLYTLLKNINQQHRNIYTVEDPVEINLPGVNQVNISERQGVTFGNVARTILRQDPDVIMLGEMRDAETVDTAIKASNTGHLVLSTLHANTAPKAIPRLQNLGADLYNISSSLSMVISQRLLRRISPDYMEPYEYSKERLLAAGFHENELAELKLFRARSTNENANGYKGRVGVFQIMPITGKLAGIIAKGTNEWEIEQYLKDVGIKDLRRAALDKVKAGVTDLEELERVLGPVEEPLVEVGSFGGGGYE